MSASESASVPAVRVETDSLGPVDVPADRLYGAQTRRAELNFAVACRPLPDELVCALLRIKRAAARVNAELGRLPADLAHAVADAATDLLDDPAARAGQFPVDVYQTGSGTSSNMNANEVVANRAIQRLGGVVGSRKPVHPNDHVNLGQSSNDVFPTAVHLAAGGAARELALRVRELARGLSDKAAAWDGVVKIGRTHLQDATPIRMGQVFAGYAAQADGAAARLDAALERDLLPVALGGTAVGTGMNTHPDFARLTLARLAEETGLAWREAPDHCAAQASMDGLVSAAGAVKAAGVALAKIANDLRFLASGPRAGLGELRLQALQPGSSIMPGKVNPVLCETLMQAAAAAVGMEAAVAFGAATLSHFELALAWPSSGTAFLDAAGAFARAVGLFDRLAVRPLAVDEARCAELSERSLALCTALAPAIGYDAAAKVSAAAARDNLTIREAAKGLLPDDELARRLDPLAMTRPDAVLP